MQRNMLRIFVLNFIVLVFASSVFAKDSKIIETKYNGKPEMKFSFEFFENPVTEGMPVSICLTLQNLCDHPVFFSWHPERGLPSIRQVNTTEEKILSSIVQNKKFIGMDLSGMDRSETIIIESNQTARLDFFLSLYYKCFECNEYKIRIVMPGAIDYSILRFKREPFPITIRSNEVVLSIKKDDIGQISRSLESLKTKIDSSTGTEQAKLKLFLLAYTAPEAIPVICGYDWNSTWTEAKYGLLSFNDPRTDMAFLRGIGDTLLIAGMVHSLSKIRTTTQLEDTLREIENLDLPLFVVVREEIKKYINVPPKEKAQ